MQVFNSDPKKLLERPRYYRHEGEDKYFDTWSLGPVIKTRDSDLVTRANYKSIKVILSKEYPLDSENCPWEISHCRHDAVGWVRHLSFQVFLDEEKTQVHPIVKKIEEIFESLSNYPLLDEELLSEMTLKYQWEVFKDECKSWLSRNDIDETDEIISQMYSYCHTHESITIEENHWDISSEALQDAYDSIEEE